MNQNPEVCVTGNSVLSDLMWRIDSVRKEEEFINFPLHKQLDNILNNIFSNFYGTINKKYIIDRSNWGLSDFLKLIKTHVNNDIKIIILVRDVLEVLSSFVDFSNKNNDFFLNKVGNNDEEKCDFLMRYDETGVGQIYGQLSAIKNLIKKENMKYIKIIEYNDFINNPQKTIDDVYTFLDIPKFNHKFTNLSQVTVDNISYNDEVLGGNLHTIRTDDIKKRKYNVSDVLSQTTISKYGNLNIWRNEN
jgi:hypothetical protein